MDSRYYTSGEVMEIFRIKKGNYATFGRLCRKLKLPRMKVGKALLFPREKFERRLEMVEKEKLRNYNI